MQSRKILRFAGSLGSLFIALTLLIIFIEPSEQKITQLKGFKRAKKLATFLLMPQSFPKTLYALPIPLPVPVIVRKQTVYTRIPSNHGRPQVNQQQQHRHHYNHHNQQMQGPYKQQQQQQLYVTGQILMPGQYFEPGAYPIPSSAVTLLNASHQQRKQQQHNQNHSKTSNKDVSTDSTQKENKESDNSGIKPSNQTSSSATPPTSSVYQGLTWDDTITKIEEALKLDSLELVNSVGANSDKQKSSSPVSGDIMSNQAKHYHDLMGAASSSLDSYVIPTIAAGPPATITRPEPIVIARYGLPINQLARLIAPAPTAHIEAARVAHVSSHMAHPVAAINVASIQQMGDDFEGAHSSPIPAYAVANGGPQSIIAIPVGP